MNRKEGTIVGIVMLATFITGVFAVPEQQILNVFVTNSQSETRVVLSQNFVVAANDTFHSEDILVDVSQFRQARVSVEILYTGDGHSTGGLNLDVTGVFPVSPPATYNIGDSVSTTGSAGTCAGPPPSFVCNVHTMSDAVTVDTPALLIDFDFLAFEDLEFTARVVVFLQK